MENSDSDDRTSTTTTSSFGYNVPSTMAPNQRDLRKQAAMRNAQAAAGAADNHTDDEQQQRQREKQAELKSKRPDLARLVTESTNLNSFLDKESAQTASKTASDAIFAQLDVIQTLQDEITREHAKLESLHEDAISPTLDSISGEGKVESPTSPTKSPDSKNTNRPSGAPKARPERHKHGQGSTAKERSAAHAYDELAAGFQERAKGVDAIMEKMSRLSQAVKEFHTLPPPVLFPDSRILASGDVVDTPIAMTPRAHQRAP